MMKELRLVKPDGVYINQYINLINECKIDIEKFGMTYLIPISDRDKILLEIHKLRDNERGLNLPDGWVPASTYWLMDRDYTCILGVISIRHALTEYLSFRGGHISYYIRLSKRTKGYATKMLGLALEKCRDLCLDKVLITCAKDNIGSAKTIEKNGGIFHSEDIEEGEEFQRYWIDIK